MPNCTRFGTHKGAAAQRLLLLIPLLSLASFTGCRSESRYRSAAALEWQRKTQAAREAAQAAPTDVEAQGRWVAAATGLSQKTAVEAFASPGEAEALAQDVIAQAEAASAGAVNAAPSDPGAHILRAWALAARPAHCRTIEDAWASVGMPAVQEADYAAQLARSDPQYVRSAADLRVYLYARLPDLVRPSPLGDVVVRIWSADYNRTSPDSGADAAIASWRAQSRIGLIDFYRKAAESGGLAAWPHQTLAWLCDLDPSAVAFFGAATTSGADAKTALDEWGEAGRLYERNVYLPLLRAVRMFEAAQPGSSSGQASVGSDAKAAEAAASPLVAAARCSKLDLPRLATPRALGQAWLDAAGVQGLLMSPRFLPGVRRLAVGQCLLAASKATEGRVDVCAYLLEGGVSWSKALMNSDVGERLTTLAGADTLETFASALQKLSAAHPELRGALTEAQQALPEAQRRRSQIMEALGVRGAGGR